MNTGTSVCFVLSLSSTQRRAWHWCSTSLPSDCVIEWPLFPEAPRLVPLPPGLLSLGPQAVAHTRGKAVLASAFCWGQRMGTC